MIRKVATVAIVGLATVLGFTNKSNGQPTPSEIYVYRSDDGKSWRPSGKISERSELGTRLTVFKGKIVMAFVANNGSGDILVSSSTDGVNWSSNTKVGQSSSCGVNLSTLNDKLLITFVGNNDDKTGLVCISNNGINWSQNYQVGKSNNAPGFAMLNNTFYTTHQVGTRAGVGNWDGWAIVLAVAISL